MRRTMIFAVMAAAVLAAQAKDVVVKAPSRGDATELIQRAVDKAVALSKNGEEVTLRLNPGVYHISRAASTPRVYHVSNTTSPDENPDPTKHIGILIDGADNLTVEATGVRFVTHGEMTPWVISRSNNVTLRGFTIDAADPSVPEMTVSNVSGNSFVAKVHPRSTYRIENGKLHWTGEGWSFTDGIAQVYDPEALTTLRCGSPVADCSMVEEVRPGELRFHYSGTMPQEVKPGVTFQMRHSFRTEVAGLIANSSNVKLENLNLHFMGNFGIVAQCSQNITYSHLNCEPDPESGRTCAGFADFLQVSGCSGLVDITDCRFAGAHDDPINVHGTHLRVVEQTSPRTIVVRYMHPQTFGFQSFFADDEVALVNDATLLPYGKPLTVKSAEMLNDHDIAITFKSDVRLPASGTYVVENLTWTPIVNIARNHFTLTPTRAILVTTRKVVTIADNRFERIPMASILVADDARSWYESGPIGLLKISNNEFVDCSAPQILIAPENSEREENRRVHETIIIEGNKFAGKPGQALVQARSVENLILSGNSYAPGITPAQQLIDCTNVVVRE